MLLSPEFNFAFVHVPKCGGTSLRDSLRGMPGIGNPLPEALSAIPFETDPHHVQLSLLRDHAPDLLEQIETCTSYALLRDPVSRFPSAVAQHCKMFLGVEAGALSTSDLEKVTRAAITHLVDDDLVLDRRYIHFERQVRFTHLDGRQVVKRLFLVNAQAALIEDIESCVGYRAPSLNKSNAAVGFRSSVLRRVRLGFPRPLKRLARDHLPLNAKRMIDRLFFRPSLTADKIAAILSPETLAFIDRFYAEDFNSFRAIASPSAP
jgi:hypothetical protein